ncbi:MULTISPECIES: DUF3667 domain-containing protein [unclassified Pedobacter]|uniref:DUF3667 domain-containing protein n=1 Tax=unclassified Pedobacter TaxID=2628915 RepID=UPI001421729A|nr:MULTISPECIES: DUF3667 domain-containing protein [unclassified Pedobacter]NII80981.1 hypothetical protein [Pedobacter sp. SG908]NMN34996.1 hypothetical protein [Pedobacter sp. SG918]
MHTDLISCRNCSHVVNDDFCGRCGQPVHIKRVDAHYILHEIQHVLHFEKGILFTVKELLIRPGQNIRSFITENRSRLVKPVIFIIVSSLIYTLISHFFHIEEGYVEFTEVKKTSIGLIFDWVQGHYGYANILMGVCISLWLKLFFKKYSYNFFEILILLCFVMGIGMLIISVFAIVEGLSKISLMEVSSIIVAVYSTWAIAQFFNGRKVVSYLKAIIAYSLGMLMFGLLAVFLGVSIDLLIKH